MKIGHTVRSWPYLSPYHTIISTKREINMANFVRCGQFHPGLGVLCKSNIYHVTKTKTTVWVMWLRCTYSFFLFNLFWKLKCKIFWDNKNNWRLSFVKMNLLHFSLLHFTITWNSVNICMAHRCRGTMGFRLHCFKKNFWKTLPYTG